MRAKTSWTLYSDVLTITLIPDNKTEAFKLGLDFVAARKAGFHVRMDAHGAIAFCLIKEKDGAKGIPAAPPTQAVKLSDDRITELARGASSRIWDEWGDLVRSNSAVGEHDFAAAVEVAIRTALNEESASKSERHVQS